MKEIIENHNWQCIIQEIYKKMELVMLYGNVTFFLFNTEFSWYKKNSIHFRRLIGKPNLNQGFSFIERDVTPPRPHLFGFEFLFCSRKLLLPVLELHIHFPQIQFLCRERSRRKGEKLRYIDLDMMNMHSQNSIQ